MKVKGKGTVDNLGSTLRQCRDMGLLFHYLSLLLFIFYLLPYKSF